MNITEILSPHVPPGALVVDLTATDAELSPHVRLPPELGTAYRTTLAAADGPAAVAVVLHQLRAVAADQPPSPDVELVVDGLARKVVHVVFADAPRTVYEHGLPDHAARAGWEITSVEATGHPVFRIALVLVAATTDAPRVGLRVINEWRLSRWIERDQARELDRVTARLDKLEPQLEAARRELDQRRAELTQLRAAHDVAARAAKENAARAARAMERLTSARGSLSFRVARATRVALRDAASSPLILPARWLAVFRGPDEIVDALREPDGKPPRR